MKIAILGGSFDPIHKMHIALAQCAMEEFSIDEVWLLPTATNPFKLGKRYAPGMHRVEMCKLAAAKAAGIEVCDAEAKKEGVCYTIDTMRILKSVFDEDEFFFLLGADTAAQVTLWKDYPALCKLMTFVIAAREEDDVPLEESIRTMKAACPEVKVLVSRSFPQNDVSSTDVRQGLRWGTPVEDLVDGDVLAHIHRHSLYPTLASITEHLKGILSEKRFNHSLEVAKRAKALALLHGAEPHKAYFAGLIHDCAKELPEEEAAALMEKYACDYTPAEETNPALRHQTLGRLYAIDVFGENDEDILASVAFHTSARAAMSKLEQIIFLADLTGEDRTYPGVENIRALSEEDLTKAMIQALREIIAMIETNDRPLDERAKEALCYFENLQTN